METLLIMLAVVAIAIASIVDAIRRPSPKRTVESWR